MVLSMRDATRLMAVVSGISHSASPIHPWGVGRAVPSRVAMPSEQVGLWWGGM
jgi:hypothetical protein